jgi:hypothetical protein
LPEEGEERGERRVSARGHGDTMEDDAIDDVDPWMTWITIHADTSQHSAERMGDRPLHINKALSLKLQQQLDCDASTLKVTK